MTDNHEGRLATVEADIRNVSQGVEKIVRFLEKRSDQHVEVMSQLAVINSKQDDMKEYQERCDGDRNAHDKRLTSVENYQHNQVKVAGGVSFAVTLLITSAIEWFKK